MRAIIIGGGICGLSCAAALIRKGWEVRVFERAPHLSEVDAGISLWANAMKALDAVGGGVGPAVRNIAEPIVSAELRRSDGKRFLVYNARALERKRNLATTGFLVHRQELLQAIAHRLPSGTITFGAELASAATDGNNAIARFTDGRDERADVLIGADGLRSAVGRSLFGERPPRYSGYTCWRGVCEYPYNKLPRGCVAEYSGRGARFGFTRLPGQRVYWFATLNTTQNGHAEDEYAEVERFTRGWAPIVRELLAATDPTRLIRTDICDRAPSRPWFKGRIVLAGDAAHPTTPNMGLGACMAMEDAPVLARCLTESPTIEAGCAAFEEARFARTSAIVKESRRMGQIGQYANPICVAARDLGTRLMPGALAFRLSQKWTRWEVA